MSKRLQTDATPAALYSTSEEIANYVTHGIGAALSVAALVLMILIALKHRDGLSLTSAIIYGSSLILLFLASTLYHAFRGERLKSVLQVVDHCSIYLLIAGTYTPFLLISLNGPWGYTLLAIIWALALMGIAFRITFGEKYPKFALFTYIGMGWLIVVAASEMLASVPPGGLALLALGGLLYTGGAVFYALEHIPYNHAIWHVFVLAAAVLHFLAIYLYVMPEA
ncbi:MAG: hemolysin D [Gammaproteobacteria bacterium]|nr:MAG: hemolysin D [Gammaproteobacteria bacterium]